MVYVITEQRAENKQSMYTLGKITRKHAQVKCILFQVNNDRNKKTASA